MLTPYSMASFNAKPAQETSRERKRRPLNIKLVLKDTVDNFASLDVAFLADMQLDELPKSAGVVVVHSLGVPKGLHDGTLEWRKDVIINQESNWAITP